MRAGLQELGRYSEDWLKAAGGGGTSTGNGTSLGRTIGQHDAGGPMTGGSYSLTGGFWPLYAVQTPGAPTLFITKSGNIEVLPPSSARAVGIMRRVVGVDPCSRR